MRARFLAAIVLATAVLVAACSGNGHGSRKAADNPPAGLDAVAASPTPLSALRVASASPVAVDHYSPCSLTGAAERQRWVDQLRASNPDLSKIHEETDLGFVSGFHGDVFPPPLAGKVAGSTAIAVVHVVRDELDSVWSSYNASFVPPGTFFGVAGRSYLAVDQMLKGDAASVTPLLTLPFFIAADSQCRPVVALGAVNVQTRLPVFADEHAVVFVGYDPGSSTLRVMEVTPIDALGRAGRSWAVLQYDINRPWKPAQTGDEFIAEIRALVATPPTGPSTLPPYPSMVNGLLFQADAFVGRNVSGDSLPVRSSPEVTATNTVGAVAPGALVNIMGEVLDGAEAEPGQGTLWYVVGDHQYIYARWDVIERQPCSVTVLTGRG